MKVSWDNGIPNIWKNIMFQTTNQSHYISHFMYIPIYIYLHIYIFIYLNIYISHEYTNQIIWEFSSSVRFPEDLLSRNTPDLLPEAPQISTTPTDAPQHPSRRKVGIQLGIPLGFMVVLGKVWFMMVIPSGKLLHTAWWLLKMAIEIVFFFH